MTQISISILLTRVWRLTRTAKIQAEDLAQLMELAGDSPEIQTAQTAFRMRIMQSWAVPEGARVLEVGCGQGDMTAVLADAVGPSGRIYAVDNASPDYGLPVTLGDSLRKLKASAIGDRIEYYLNYDILNRENTFADDAFDCVVLAHCSWFFDSYDVLRRILLRVRPWATRLCFSEWDMTPTSMDQVAHMLAILVQGQIGCYNPRAGYNARSPISKLLFEELLVETGWKVTSDETLSADGLQNANWEILNCLVSSMKEAELLDIPHKLMQLLRSQTDTLSIIAGNNTNRSLDSYSIVAERSN